MMNRILIYMLYVYAMLCCPMIYGQADSVSGHSCRIHFSGRVVDGESKQPLEGASVVLNNGAFGTSTNAEGVFYFSSLCPGTYHIECASFGFKPIQLELSLRHNIHRSFVLHSDTCELESVVITIAAEELKTAQPFTELKGKALDRTRGLSLGESLKAIPGVSTIQTGPTIFKPVVQGMYGNRVLIMNNGVRQEGQQWGSEHAPEIDPFIAGKMTVVRGASGVRYGADAIGGVILIESRELRKKPGLSGEVNLAGFSNNREGVASGILDFSPAKIRGLSTRIQGTIKQAGNSKTPAYYLKNTSFAERNFSWTLGYRREKLEAEVFYSQFNTKVGIFAASHIGNLTDLQKAISSPVPVETSGFTYAIERPYQQVSHELFKIRTVYKFSRLGKIEVIAARQFNYRAEYDKHRPYNNDLKDEPQTEFNITTHTASVSFTHYTFRKFSGDIGTMLIRQGNTTGGTAIPLIPNFKSMAMGFFVIERYKLRHLELEAGVRYDFKDMQVFKYENNVLISPSYAFSNFSGTGGAIFMISEYLRLRTNIGTSFRPPSVNELFSSGLHHGAASIESGDRNLKPEVSYNLNLSLNYQFPRMYGELNMYHNEVKDYIFLAPVVQYDPLQGKYVPEYRLTIRGAFPVFQYQQINAAFTGFDFSLNDSLSRHFILGSKLSVLRSFNQTKDEYLILAPPASIENALQYHFSLFRRLEQTYLQLSHQYVFRKSKVPLNEDLTAPPAGYLLLNMEAGCTIHVGKVPAELIFSIYNLLNTRYRSYLDRFRYFADATGRNVVMRIKIPFDLSGNKK